MEHFIDFGGKKGKFIIDGINCDLIGLGFIPSDKSLPLEGIIPIKFVGGDKIFHQLSVIMLEREADMVVLGDTYYLLRVFSENDQILLALAKPKNPLFPSQSFDGNLFIREYNASTLEDYFQS